MTTAYLDYKFKLACDEKVDLYDIVAKQACGLSFVPGAVLGNSSISCAYPWGEIKIAPCQTYAAISASVEMEAHCLPICGDMGQCAEKPGMNDGCTSCCIWTSTTKKANKSCVCIGDVVTYTITFTNHSPCNLDMVYISDKTEAEVTVVPGSLYPAPKPGETLQTGISVGSVPACASVTMTYQVRIRSCTSDHIVNYACVRYAYQDCRGCLRYGVGRCTRSVIKRLPNAAKISVVKSADKRFVCATGEEIHYTLTISSTGSSAVTNLMVYDDLPQGLCYQENSTRRNNGASGDGNPACGIDIGMLLPGETYLVSFVLVVCMPICCICQPTEFVNTASASGCACGREVSGKSEPWVVTMKGRCFCQCVRVCLPIGDYVDEKNCYIYLIGATYHELGDWRLVSAKYGICIKYMDRSGVVRNKTFERNVTFFGLPEDFTPDQFTIRFTHLNCCNDLCGNMIAEFAAHLQYCDKR